MQSKMLSIVLTSWLLITFSQELSGENLIDRELIAFPKLARFAFAKRYQPKFAFAKKLDADESNCAYRRPQFMQFYKVELKSNVEVFRAVQKKLHMLDDMDKRAMRFAFAKKSLRNFAFVDRDPYLTSFA